MQLANIKQSLLLIVLGLVFTQLIIANYSLFDGFNYYGIKLQTGSFLSVLKFNENRFLTTRFIGYIFFAAFAYLKFKNGIKNHRVQFILVSSVCAFLYEVRCNINDLSNSYDGNTVQIGWVLFFISLAILRDKIYNR